jgi:hypothetical protein
MKSHSEGQLEQRAWQQLPSTARERTLKQWLPVATKQFQEN